MSKRNVRIEVGMPLAATRQQPATGVSAETKLLTQDGAECLNMRASASGGIESFAMAETVGRCRYEPVFADVRFDRVYIFTLDPWGGLRAELIIGPDGEATMSDTKLGTMAVGRCRGVRAGDFVVFADSEERLYYLEWDSRRRKYEWLGSLPGMPEVRVEATNSGVRQATVPPQIFSHPIDDIRQGLTAEVSQQVVKGVADTVLGTRKISEETGHWTTPVMVRIGVRLWDGGLLYLSTPQLVAPCQFVSPRRVMLGVDTNGTVATATQATHISVPEYQLKVILKSNIPSVWGELVSQTEVWVSPVPVITAGGASLTGYNSATRMISVTPGYPTEEELTRRLLSSGWECVATLPFTGGRSESVIGRPAESKKVEAGSAEVSSQRITHASAIAGHGGFLHLAGYTKELPEPSLPQGEPGATESATARVSVRISTTGGERTVTVQGVVTADAGRILPLMWYPDRNAVKIRVGLEYADGRRYEKEFPMSALTAENVAVAEMKSTDAISLPAVEELSEDDEDDGVAYADGTVITMQRGNPFVVCSSTSHAGGHINHIFAQQSGGGAYTRQYLYLFSDTGIVALTHDMEGRHTNCRPVSRQAVGSELRVCGGENAVWALSDSGILLRLKDSRVESMLRGVSSDYMLGANESVGELWLVPEPESRHTKSGALDVTSGSRLPISYSDWMPHGLLSAGSRLLGITPRGLGTMRVWEISEIPVADLGCTRMQAQWESGIIRVERGGIVYVEMDIYGDSPDARIEIHGVTPSGEYDAEAMTDATLLWSGRLTRSNHSTLSVPIILPDASVLSQAVRIRVRVSGKFERIKSIGLRYG